MNVDWMDGAACRDYDADLWHDKSTHADARHICLSHCLVRLKCKEWAHAQKPLQWAEQVLGGEVWVTHNMVHKPSSRPVPPSTAGCSVCREEP